MTAVRGVLIALIVASVVLGGLVGHASADPENLQISDVSIEPDPPAPGEPFLVTTTITNGEGGSGSAEVTDVYVRAATGLPEYERVENLGSVGDGQSLTVPLQLSLDTSRNLRVHVIARANDGESIHLEYPIYVTVKDADDVQLSFASTDAVADTETPVTVTVANGDTSAISNVQLTLNGASARVRDPRRAIASVPGSSERTVTYNVTFDEPGDRQLTANLSYTTDEGYRRSVQESVSLPVEAANVDVALDASTAGAGAVNPPVTVDVSNLGNVPVADVTVHLEAEGRTIARRLVGDLPAQTSRSVVVNVSGLDDAKLTVTARYAFASRTSTASTTLDYRSNPGRIELTGVDVEPADGHLQITGSASNVGLGAVNSVVVRVIPTDGVEPVPPNREYFVGTVPASDFVSFDLTARVDAGVEAVPVEVTYLADGHERRERISVPVDARPEPSDEGATGADRGLLVPALVGALVVVLVGVLVYVGWSNRGGR